MKKDEFLEFEAPTKSILGAISPSLSTQNASVSSEQMREAELAVLEDSMFSFEDEPSVDIVRAIDAGLIGARLAAEIDNEGLDPNAVVKFQLDRKIAPNSDLEFAVSRKGLNSGQIKPALSSLDKASAENLILASKRGGLSPLQVRTAGVLGMRITAASNYIICQIAEDMATDLAIQAIDLMATNETQVEDQKNKKKGGHKGTQLKL